MKPTKFTEAILIARSNAQIFDYTQDYANRLKWDTFLKRADLIEGALVADKGGKAYCVAKNGLGMVTEYVTFKRPKATAIKITKGPYLFKTFLGSWTFKQMGAEITEVIFLYSYTLRFPFNLAGAFIKRNLQRNVRGRLKDLKKNLETQQG